MPEWYEWTFPDGSAATGPTASRTVDSTGLNAVTLAVQYTGGTTRRPVEYVPVGTDTTTVVTDAPSEEDGLAARFDRPRWTRGRPAASTSRRWSRSPRVQRRGFLLELP